MRAMPIAAFARLAPSPLLFSLLVFVAASTLAGDVRADLMFETATVRFGAEPEAPRTAKIWLDATHLRMEFDAEATPGGRKTIVLFDANPGAYHALDPQSQSYAQLDRAEMQALGSRVEQTVKEMKARVAELPADQQAVVRKMIHDMSPPSSNAPIERLVSSDEQRTIDGLPARRFELILGDRLAGEVWATEFDAVGIERAELAVFNALAAFQEDLVQTLGTAAGQIFAGQPLSLFERAESFPLRMRRIDGGRVESETRFGLPQHISPEPGRYAVPVGYVRVTGPGQPSGAERP